MKNDSLESKMAELKNILAEMEEEGKTIDEMHKLYKRGTVLSKEISNELKAMSGQIKLYNNDLTEYAEEDGDNE